MTTKSNWDFLKLVAVILIVGFMLRLVWGALVEPVPFSDSEAYDILARNLAEHGIYGWSESSPSAYWPPGTSAIYAVLYSAFGHTLKPVVVLNIALSTGIIGLTIWLSCVVFNRTTGIAAGLVMAVWPAEISYVTVLASELPFTFLVLAGCVAWFEVAWTRTLTALIGGLAFGAASYFRSIASLLPLVLWFSALPNWRKFRKNSVMVVVAMLVILLTLAPWSVRNAKVFGHFVPMTTSDGVNLWMGNNANSDGFYMPLPPTVRGLSEYQQNRILTEDAMLFIMEHPGTFILRCIQKIGLLHSRETVAITWNMEGIKKRFGESVLLPLKWADQLFWGVVLLFALAGIAQLCRVRGVTSTITSPPVLIWAYFTAIYSIFVVADRYHFPSHPFIAMLASVAVISIAKIFRPADVNGEMLVDRVV